MFSKIKTKQLCVGAVLAATCLASPASAAQFLFTFDSSTIDVTGTLTTEDVPNASGQVLITDLAGTVDGFGAISLIAPGGFVGNDNLLNPTSSELLTGNGFSFAATGLRGNIFFSQGLSTFALFGEVGSVVGPLGIGSFTITRVGNPPPPPPVPEPTTWALMLLGFGFVGAAMRRRGVVRATVAYT